MKEDEWYKSYRHKKLIEDHFTSLNRQIEQAERDIKDWEQHLATLVTDVPEFIKKLGQSCLDAHKYCLSRLKEKLAFSETHKENLEFDEFGILCKGRKEKKIR